MSVAVGGTVQPMAQVSILSLINAFVCNGEFCLSVLQIRSKRKAFSQLSKYGKRKCVRDIRVLLKKKGAEYEVPVTTIAGYLIQQV